MSNYFSMEAFDYDDIQLVPNKGIIKSRRDADTSVKFGNRTLKYRLFLPIWKVSLMITLLFG